jgi:hypothetical protein
MGGQNSNCVFNSSAIQVVIMHLSMHSKTLFALLADTHTTHRQTGTYTHELTCCTRSAFVGSLGSLGVVGKDLGQEGEPFLAD